MNRNDKYLGVVHDGKFQQLLPVPGPGDRTRFTGIQVQQAVTPERGELELSTYEGSAIMIHGHDHGKWVFSAEVFDEAGSILTAMVQEMFGGSASSSD
jgi:hypothetical protein